MKTTSTKANSKMTSFMERESSKTQTAVSIRDLLNMEDFTDMVNLSGQMVPSTEETTSMANVRETANFST